MGTHLDLNDVAAGNPLAEEELAALRARVKEEEAAGDLHRDINRRTALALGKPLSGEGSSWHDIPERVSALVVRVKEVDASVRSFLEQNLKQQLAENVDGVSNARKNRRIGIVEALLAVLTIVESCQDDPLSEDYQGPTVQDRALRGEKRK